MRRAAALLAAGLAAGPLRAAAPELAVPARAPEAPALVVAPAMSASALPLFPALAPALAPRTPPSAAAAAPAAAPETPAAASLPLDPQAGVYERRGVGLLAVDFKGSTRLHYAQGNRRAHAIVAGALDYAAAAAAAFDGAVVRRVGDGYLFAFPSFDRALDAAAAIQGGLEPWRRRAGLQPFVLHAGAHAGRVLVDASGPAPEVYGEAVERTFALASASRGADVAVDPGAADHPALRRRKAVFTGSERADGALLLRPRAQSLFAAPALEPPLAAARFVNAATLFAGLADWSPTYARYGRRAAYATVKAFHEHVRAAAERNGGFVVKTDGETVMASFPSAAAAVRAGREIQSRLGELRRAAPLGRVVSARVGVSWGRVLREDRLEGADFFGNTVNAAARLMRLAGDGELLVSAYALDDADAARELAAAARESVPLRGFDRPVSVLRLRPEPAAEDLDGERLLRDAASAAQARVAPPRPG
jgi:class 3 adenylate cyclase